MDYKKHLMVLSVIENLQAHGSWTGKTHIQKAFSLLADLSEITVPFEFVLYKHGPYSFDLEAELEEMNSYGGVEVLADSSGYGVKISSGPMASYIRNRAQLSTKEDRAVNKICEFVRDRNVVELERLATAAWIRKHENKASASKIAQRLHQLKPHVSVQDAKEADKELRSFSS